MKLGTAVCIYNVSTLVVRQKGGTRESSEAVRAASLTSYDSQGQWMVQGRGVLFAWRPYVLTGDGYGFHSTDAERAGGG